MNKEKIKEKLINERNARLIDVIKINDKSYAKAIIKHGLKAADIDFRYFEVTNDQIKDIDEAMLDNVIQLFENDLGNRIY